MPSVMTMTDRRVRSMTADTGHEPNRVVLNRAGTTMENNNGECMHAGLCSLWEKNTLSVSAGYPKRRRRVTC